MNCAAAGVSWTSTYVGMGFNGDMMTEASCLTQYMLSLYYAMATLVTSGLVMGMHPTTWLEVLPFIFYFFCLFGQHQLTNIS
jgi:hypothetical protein